MASSGEYNRSPIIQNPGQTLFSCKEEKEKKKRSMKKEMKRRKQEKDGKERGKKRAQKVRGEFKRGRKKGDEGRMGEVVRGNN